MSLIQDAQKKLGELFLVGFDGTELSDDTAAFISQAGIGGIILFSRNYQTPEQVGALVNQIQECRVDLPLWIAVDQEGGRVQRFKAPFTILPTAAEVAAANSPKLTFEIAEMCAKELAAVGVNLNFAPVADINTNPNNPIIGDRAYGSDEEEVTKHVTAIVRGHVVQGVQPCVKHFPGHGETDVDSHLALPKLRFSLEELKNRELKPFVKSFKSRCNMVMTAHILFEKLDPEVPITLSSKVLRDLLRKDLRYSKIIFSDDMEMQAITDHYGAEEAPLMAVKAGCDILIYRSEGAARKAYASLYKALDQEKLPADMVIEAANRSIEVKKEVLGAYQPVNIAEIKTKVGLPEHKALLERLKNP
ncbi:MAG: beta-N-acetylhexosaminidase [Bacteriovoracia bacterium]